MQTYLTDVWNLSFTHAAAILNIWGGISWILPAFFLFLADACIGHFKMILISSIANCMGIGTCKENEAECIGETRKATFYTGMALLAVGFGGHRASLKPYNDLVEDRRRGYITSLNLLLVLFVPLTNNSWIFCISLHKAMVPPLWSFRSLCALCNIFYNDEVVPVAAFWLFFPFFLIAGVDSFFKKSAVAFFENESPNTAMKRYCSCFTEAVSGLGLMYSMMSVDVVGKISETGGRQSWFQHSLNDSRLDKYYWVLAALSALNLLVFVPLASLYKYKNPETNEQAVVGDIEG